LQRRRFQPVRGGKAGQLIRSLFALEDFVTLMNFLDA
jgi:hypothetical protein